MIYRDRKHLSILTLTEDADYVTCDELIRVLEARPADAVYVERDGMLCGMLTNGDILRGMDRKTRLVWFHKKFAFVHQAEYMRARRIFAEKPGVYSLPVVSEDGRLLGDYLRWNGMTGTDYFELLCKDPHVLQGLKANVHDAVFVKPSARGGVDRTEMFLWWKQRLKSEGIRLPTIRREEIRDSLNDVKYFLFADEDEKRGTANLDLLHQRTGSDKYFTISGYLEHMRKLSDISFLKELQSRGVFVLTFDIVENNDHFLSTLCRRIGKRNREYGVDSNLLPEELKEIFFDELYSEAYRSQTFPLPMSFHARSGIPYWSDTETEFLHVRNGERLTADQPEEYARCIYFYGPCVVTGIYVPDRYTIPSLLQSELNQAGLSCKVVNRGFLGERWRLSADRVQASSFRRGDVVVMHLRTSPVEDLPVLNLTDALEERDPPADWFVNIPGHCNHKANQLYAHEIYKELLPVLRQTPEERSPVEMDHDYIGRFYLRHYFSDFDPAGYDTVGSIVMNCNPFTFGHRFLIEEALKMVDHLIIFVVEDDGSLFSFQERFAMVCRGTAGLERITVVPSGLYILSKNTFPEYFQKTADEDLRKNTEDDITLFAERIAPALGITYRFVGEEREDEVTNEYNEAMKRILPDHGIRVVEIPRKANGRSAVSASRVRDCLSVDRTEELDELIPASTKRLLFPEYK